MALSKAINHVVEKKTRKKKAYVVDQPLNLDAQLVLLVLLARDGRERGADAIGRGAPHVVDEVDKVLGRLELDLARLAAAATGGHRWFFLLLRPDFSRVRAWALVVSWWDCRSGGGRPGSVRGICRSRGGSRGCVALRTDLGKGL